MINMVIQNDPEILYIILRKGNKALPAARPGLQHTRNGRETEQVKLTNYRIVGKLEKKFKHLKA